MEATTLAVNVEMGVRDLLLAWPRHRLPKTQQRSRCTAAAKRAARLLLQQPATPAAVYAAVQTALRSLALQATLHCTALQAALRAALAVL